MIRIQVFNNHPTTNINTSVFTNLARNVLRHEGTSDATCNVVFVDDKYMKRLNRTYLRHDATTDVLSFSLSERSIGRMEGEVYVNADQAKRQSRTYAVTFKNELARLVIHGILHLIGYRDGTAREKMRMSRQEDKYLHLLQ